MNKIVQIMYHIYIYLFRNNTQYIKLYWFEKQNFGDSINPYLIEKLSFGSPGGEPLPQFLLISSTRTLSTEVSK